MTVGVATFRSAPASGRQSYARSCLGPKAALSGAAKIALSLQPLEAVRVSLSAIPECIHRRRAGCGAHGHPVARSEYGRRDHDITKVAPAFWAISVLEKTPSAASFDGSAERFCRRLFLMLRPVKRGLHVRGPFLFRHCQPGRKNQILWLRSAEILQWGKEKIHVSFAYHCGRAASAKRSRVRRADVGGVRCLYSTYRS